MPIFSRRGPVPERYEALRSLGRGGAAVVSRCFDRVLRRIVAVKELREDAAATEHKRVAFQREVRLLSFLEHPGIVPIHDHFDGPSGAPAYAMKLVAGETLAERIAYDPEEFQAERQPVEESLRIVTRLAETLAYAQDRGVYHLDLKPENVMLGKFGAVYLMDWGNALLADPEPYRAELGELAQADDVDELLREPHDLIMGTPLFMSPEQTTEARRDIGPASDVFSLGVLWHLLLSGELPFRGDSIPEILGAIRKHEVPALRSLRPDVPLRISAIVQRMLAKQPAQRLPDVRSVLVELRALNAAGVAFPTRSFQRGEVIFREGDEGACSYLVLEGRVGVSRHGAGGERELAQLEPGEMLGEVAVLGSGPRSASARALEDCVLRVLPGKQVREELEKLSPWVGSLIATLERRFRELQRQLDAPDEAQ